MTKLLIFIGEGQKFDTEPTIDAIVAMRRTTHARRGNFIGAIFECEYSFEGESTLIRLSPDAETVSVEGLNTCSLSFALELQQTLSVGLQAVDMEYSFHISLSDFHTLESLRLAISV